MRRRDPAGASAELGGVTSQQGDAFGQLGLALLVAILIVYVVMVATFKSLRQPLLLLVSVPFAATGAILLQLISGIPLGVPSLIGVLMLIGIVVTNAIVLVDLVNKYRERGMKVGDAIIHGASRRLRPILMTATATIFALLPLGLGVTGQGGFISQPLAIIVIGGLVSSTVLTLVVLPVLYYLVEGAKERRADKRAARESTRWRRSNQCGPVSGTYAHAVVGLAASVVARSARTSGTCAPARRATPVPPVRPHRECPPSAASALARPCAHTPRRQARGSRGEVGSPHGNPRLRSGPAGEDR